MLIFAATEPRCRYRAAYAMLLVVMIFDYTLPAAAIPAMVTATSILQDEFTSSVTPVDIKYSQAPRGVGRGGEGRDREQQASPARRSIRAT